MKNEDVADRLFEIADYLEMRDVEYKPRAYRRAARNVESLPGRSPSTSRRATSSTWTNIDVLATAADPAAAMEAFCGFDDILNTKPLADFGLYDG